jgi:hypothetical protein
MSNLGATIKVSWGNDVMVSIHLTPRNWAKVKAGKVLQIRGRGYYYEGEFFRDYWYFEGGHEGALVVHIGDGGTGFDGRLNDAEIQEHPVSKSKKNHKP